MRWEDRGRSRSLEDRRGGSGGRGAPVGGSLGLGGLLLVLVLSWATAIAPLALLGMVGPTGGSSAPPAMEAPVQDASEEESVRFVSFVLDDARAMWSDLFERSDLEYEEARLVLFRDAVSSACGTAPSAVGPFYCPIDGNDAAAARSIRRASPTAPPSSARTGSAPASTAAIPAPVIRSRVDERPPRPVARALGRTRGSFRPAPS